MSLGISVTNYNFKAAEGKKYRSVKFTGDGSYSAGGYAVTAANLNFPNAIVRMTSCTLMASEGSGGTALGMSWDVTNSKLKLWKGAAAPLTECAAGDPREYLPLQGVALGGIREYDPADGAAVQRPVLLKYPRPPPPCHPSREIPCACA